MEPIQLLTHSECIYPQATVEVAISELAGKLTQAFQYKSPLVVTVMNGGLYFAGQLLPKLDFPLETDYLHATRYNGETLGKEIQWRVTPNQKMKGRTVLLLDDILDEGYTLAAIRDKCLALGALEVKIAVLVEKTLDKVKPIKADFVGLPVPNRYVFGCGMDVYGWWRNLSEIRALKG